MTSRPRRSNVSTTYAHLLTPLDLGNSSSSSSSDETPAGDKGKGKAKEDPPDHKKKKRKQVYIPEESSGSEFELADKPTGSRAGGDSDEDEEDAGTGLDSDDLDDGESVSGASGLSGSVVGASPPRSARGGRGRGRGGGRGRGPARKASHAVVVTTSAAAQRAGSAAGGLAPPRAKPPQDHPHSGLGNRHPYIGPLAAFAPSVGLEGAERGKGGSFAAGAAGDARVLRDREVDELLEAQTGNPFGVGKDEMRDMGYVPGRFEAIAENGEKLRERERWGGWYEEHEVRSEDIEAVPAHEIAHFLPAQVYANRPSAIFTPSAPLPGTAEAAAAAEEAASPAPGTPATGVADELPVPPPQFRTGEASAPPAQAQAQPGAGDGRIGVKCGGLVAHGVEEQTLELKRFETKRLDEIVSKKPGHLFNAGAPIGSLAWAPRSDAPVDNEYLLVTTTSTPDAPLRHHPSSSTPVPPRALLQLWSVPSSCARETDPTDDARMRLELALCVEGLGECTAAVWCPLGGHAATGSSAKGKERADAMDVDERDEGEDKLGLIAGVFADGSAAVLVAPEPARARAKLGVDEGEVAYVKAKPLLRLCLPDTSIYSIAWGGHEVLAAGCSNGWISVWHVGNVLRSGKQPERPLRPTHYFSAHTALVRQLVFVATPPPSLVDRTAHDLDGVPTGIVSVGYDGSAVLSDLREPGGGGSTLTHERTGLYALAFSPNTGMAYTHDADDRVKALGLKPSMQGAEGRVTVHRGTIWSIAASPHHSTVLSTSLDGSANLSSGVRSLRKRRVRGHFIVKLFRLEVERATGDVRMWDNLEVEHRVALDPYNPRAKDLATGVERPTAAWPAAQAVTAAAWHPALARAALCATGTAVGLGRVDWAEGAQTARA